MNVELGMHWREVADDLRQQIGRNRRDHADAQPAREPVARRAREVFQFIDQAQDVANAWGGLFSERGERDLSRASLQQHTAQRVLQILDLHRQSRLRDRTCFCRAPEMALTGQRIEITQLPKRYHKKILPQRSLKSTLPDGLGCVDWRGSKLKTMPTPTRRQYGCHHQNQVPIFER